MILKVLQPGDTIEHGMRIKLYTIQESEEIFITQNLRKYFLLS